MEVIDLTIAQRYLKETRAIALRLPDGWQGNDGRRHQYRWRVGLRSGAEIARTVWTEEREFRMDCPFRQRLKACANTGMALALGVVMAACSLGRPAERPLERAEFTATASPTRAVSAGATATTPATRSVPAASAAIVIASPLPTDTPLPASATAGPTQTPAPYEHVIQGGDTLGYVIQQYGYRSTDSLVMERIVAMNANIADANTLPGPGSVILIPQPSPTPLPPGVELTATADAELGTITRGGITLAAGSELIEHKVLVNETMIEIAEIYKTTLEILNKLNPRIDFSGCDFSLPGGGGECNPFIAAGQIVTVPGPTPMPTRRPTPSGSETATPTPSPRAPQLLAPAPWRPLLARRRACPVLAGHAPAGE